MKTANNQNKFEMEETNKTNNFDNEREEENYDYGRDYYDDYDQNDWMSDTWDAMTDGMYGDMPEGFNGDFDWLGY